MQQGKGQAVNLLCRQVPADQRDGPDRPEALKALIIADQTLGAPACPVGAETHAVPHKADDLFLDQVVRQTGGEVGVVVLDAEQRYPLSFRPLGGILGG